MSAPGDPWTAADRLLVARGAGDLDHPGGDLLSHLRRTGALLRGWGEPEATCLAGLAHAAYGTDGFPTALLGLDERPLLVDAVGAEAEAIVWTYGACDRAASEAGHGRTPLVLVDRHDGAEVPLDPAAARAFAALTMANETDIACHGTLPEATVAAIRVLVDALAPHAPDVADRARAALDGTAGA